MKMNQDARNVIHDGYFDITGTQPTDEKIVKIYLMIPNNIKNLAEQWGWSDTEVRELTYNWINNHKEELVNMTIEKTEALIIVDMSHDFVADDGGLTVGKPAQEIVPYIIDLANSFLKDNKTVVVTMDSHEENDPHFELWAPHNIVGTKGQELYGDLHTWYNDNVGNENLLYVPKTNYNAFFNTELAQILKINDVEKVHVVGVCTDICNFQTIAGADAEGFKTVIHPKGSATFTGDGKASIEHMKLCFHTEVIE